MNIMMKRKMNKDFEEIEVLKDIYRKRIRAQEESLKASYTGLRDNLTGAVLLNKIRENLFGGPGLAFRLGFMAVTLIRRKMKQKQSK
jgi:hypothetical protein